MSEMEHSNTEGAQELGEGQSDARDYEFEARQLGWKDPSDPDYKGDRTKRFPHRNLLRSPPAKFPCWRLTAKTPVPHCRDGKEVHQARQDDGRV